jgi:hypothetical protein
MSPVERKPLLLRFSRAPPSLVTTVTERRIMQARTNVCSRGEAVERELDRFIAHRHDKRALSEGERLEEALFRANERRAQEKRRQERRAGLLANERHLRSVYFRLYKEKDESVAFLEGRAP